MSFLPNSFSGAETGPTSGFTLVEVLLSVTILAIISSVIYSSLFSSLDAMDSTRTKMDHYERVRLLFSMIEMDLQGAYSSPYTDYYSFRGINDDHEGKPADRIIFLSTTHKRMTRNAAETDLCEIEYALQAAPDDEKGHRLFRRSDPTPDRDMETGGTSWEIMTDIVSLDFQYYEYPDWKNEWESKGLNTALPQAVKITLVLALNDDTEQTFSDWITLPLRG